MSDTTTSHDHGPPSAPSTIAEIVDGLEPITDLTEFEIDDLTPEEEDEFFAILAEL